MQPLPTSLKSWLTRHEGLHAPADEARIPGSLGTRPFVLATVRLQDLKFEDHSFNPRTPQEAKVNELQASIRRLSLLNPLICAAPRDPRSEKVVLIDGRHRYEAIKRLMEEDPQWADRGRIDVKVYFGLEESELYLLATYLNRNRKALNKGEYFRSVDRIFDARNSELASELGRAPTELETVRSLHGRELANRDFDASIGRLIAKTALLGPDQGSWFPLVGANQNQLLDATTGLPGFAPITAGNLAAFMAPLCRDKPYDDIGETRARETKNFLRLGTMFRQALLKPVPDYRSASATSIACKHWVIAAFGEILAESRLFNRREGEAPLASNRIDWAQLLRVMQAYARIMGQQAVVVNKFRDTASEEFLDRAWSYQTQKNQVSVRLKRELEKRLKGAV